MPRVTIKALQAEIQKLEEEAGALHARAGKAERKAAQFESAAKIANQLIERNKFENDRYAALHREFAFERVRSNDLYGAFAAIRSTLQSQITIIDSTLEKMKNG